MCAIPRQTRHRVSSLINAELCTAHRRLFEEWWNPQTVHNEFFKITQQHIFSELSNLISTHRLNMLLQIPS
ncbi:MAG: hypothetical protein IJB64_05120 [Akkermansia sp.]|nr:hypothetical protein [Akkermansia sp.]